jgi:hypothetical protein
VVACAGNWRLQLSTGADIANVTADTMGSDGPAYEKSKGGDFDLRQMFCQPNEKLMDGARAIDSHVGLRLAISFQCKDENNKLQ